MVEQNLLQSIELPILLYEFDKGNIETSPLNFRDNKDKFIALIAELLDTDYFDTPKLAIQIYKHIIDTYKFIPKPIVLEKALAFYTAKKKGLRLAKQKPKDGHTVFVKVGPSLRKEGLAN